jgi:D,D-heptose 1,7-bisphosphate phosphatase
VNQAIILCGGYGKRLINITKKIPKPLIKVYGKPFIEHLIFQYSRFGVKKIILLCSYKSFLFKKKYHNKSLFGCNIFCFEEKKPTGTASALKKVYNKMDKIFYLSNGDTIADFNLLNLKKNLKKKDHINFAIIKKKNNQKRYCGFKIKKNNFIKFSNYSNYVNTGYSIVRKKLIKKIKTNDYNFEKDFLFKQKNLSIKGQLLDKKHNAFLDIGTPKDLDNAENFLMKFYKKKAVFLDRDGVIIKDYGYVYKITDITYINNIFNIIKFLNDNNYYVFVVTNQSGVGRGYYTSKAVNKLHKKINNDLSKYDAHIDEFVYAPYFYNSKIKFTKKDELMRKPNKGMISYLFKKWEIDKKKSLIVGDKECDKKLAKNCKIKYFDINTKNQKLMDFLKKKS